MIEILIVSFYTILRLICGKYKTGSKYLKKRIWMGIKNFLLLNVWDQKRNIYKVHDRLQLGENISKLM